MRQCTRCDARALQPHVSTKCRYDRHEGDQQRHMGQRGLVARDLEGHQQLNDHGDDQSRHTAPGPKTHVGLCDGLGVCAHFLLVLRHSHQEGAQLLTRREGVARSAFKHTTALHRTMAAVTACEALTAWLARAIMRLSVGGLLSIVLSPALSLAQQPASASPAPP